ncbi:IS66 family insertion sequence element accessory protein TnpB [Rhizobium phaseoli]|uniref:IS66 family insertion sequence element accessory protein TnpB n=1 Tax=Rhizobium phaseoli TaxID=396 RepID=UPI000A1C1703|nr:IS66 family insertion sequence element accessory protein TnpB [Rhizobium phaseoli]ARM13701.1 IS66 family insertion sequence transposase domain-containing protein [Rhizobium phaseoli Brasil 5]
MGIKDETDALPALTAYLRWQWLYSVVRYKKLERGRFIWPSAADGTVVITPAQLGYLLEGIDWRMPQKTWRPTSAG